jgi:hypothetical protein
MEVCFWLNCALALAAVGAMRTMQDLDAKDGLAGAAIVHCGMALFAWLMLRYVLPKE